MSEDNVRAIEVHCSVERDGELDLLLLAPAEGHSQQTSFAVAVELCLFLNPSAARIGTQLDLDRVRHDASGDARESCPFKVERFLALAVSTGAQLAEKLGCQRGIGVQLKDESARVVARYIDVEECVYHLDLKIVGCCA